MQLLALENDYESLSVLDICALTYLKQLKEPFERAIHSDSKTKK
jgi:hypothetical protein